MKISKGLSKVVVLLNLSFVFVSFAACDDGFQEKDIDISENGTSTTSPSAFGYPIVDTGQKNCYDDSQKVTPPAIGDSFYGQDAQFDGNQPNYTISKDGLTVYDNITGLTWTKSPDINNDGKIDAKDKLAFYDAQKYPVTLNKAKFGGYDDWRLPTMKELYSLMDFNGTDPAGVNASNTVPFINTDYFDFGYGDTGAGERMIDAQFWSNNVYGGYVFTSQKAAFGLNLADGRIKGYPISGNVAKSNYVYFVRGNTSYGKNNFKDNGDGTISDLATGLMWAKDDSGDGKDNSARSGMDWKEALEWVLQKNKGNYLGHNDWRLPNAKEMQSIVDYSRSPDVTGSASIDPIFGITEIINEDGKTDYPWFWTGTTHIRSDGNASSAVYICFGRALGYNRGAWVDVHGAGCQRSDQKVGNFDKYTYVPQGYYFERSPQGDAVRMYNYVRLVR